MNEKNQSFEQNMARLEQIVRAMERGDVALEESLKLFQEGTELVRSCSKMLEEAEDPEEIWHLKRRIYELTPLLTQMNELADLTAHYYERGYWRSEKYTL